MTSNRSIHDLLQEEATLAFAEAPLVQLVRDCAIYLYTPQLKNRLSLLQYYTHLNVYFLERPQCLLAYLQKSPPSTVNIGLYLQSLRALAHIYCVDAGRYKHLKQLYLVLARVPEVKERLSKDCTVPQDIAVALECLHRTERKGNSEASDLQAQSIAYSKLMLLSTLFDHNSQVQVETMWSQLLQITEEGKLNGLKVFDLITGSVLSKGSVELCATLLLKFQQLLGGETIIQHLLLKIKNSNYYKQGERLIFRAKLVTLLQDENMPSPPNQDTLKLLCLMSQQGTAKLESIFPLLTPEMKFLCDVAEMHVDFHEDYVKRCWQQDYEGRTDVVECLWGELAFSSKLEFLNQMILVNDFKGFTRLMERHGLKLDLVYHPRIIASLGMLLEWIVDPIHQIIGYSRYFPKKRAFTHFPPGSFRQCFEVSNYLLQTIGEVLNVGRSYIFAKKSTFTKLCRVLRSICNTKDTRIPMESPQMVKKVGSFTANLIKRHILPAIEYYENDPTVAFELDRLIDCFRFKVQLDIYLHVIREQRLSNLHLAIHYHEIGQEQTRLLNRLSPGATQVVSRMAALMGSHPFSALDPIFKRIQLNDKGLLAFVYSAIHKTPYLTRKVALFYSFLYLFEDNKPECGKKYIYLVDMTRQLLLHERQPDDFLRTIVEYVAARLSYLKEDSRLDIYIKEINYLTDILEGFLPVELQENFVNKNNNCRYLAAGPYLKAWLMQKTQKFYSREALRRSLLGCMFRPNAKEIVDNYFFYLLLKLNNRLIIVSTSLHSELSVSAEIYDKILCLMLNLINIAHFQMTAPFCERHFGIKIFKQLTVDYKLPYQLAFYVVRRTVTHRMQQQNYDLTGQQIWQGLKSDIQGPLQQVFQENGQLKQFQPNSYSRDTRNSFFRTDIFLLFWIQEIQYAHFNHKPYDEALAAIRTGCFKAKLDEELLSRITADIAAEGKRYGECFNKLKDGKSKRADYSSKVKCYEGSRQEEIMCLGGLLIKFCILPRAALSKSEAYYCWQFYFNFLFENKCPAVITVKLLCLLLESISSYIPFATLREATELLPLLYSSAAAAVKWKGPPQCNEKLPKRGLTNEKITVELFDNLERIVYESQNEVIRLLFDNKGMEEFSVKNCMLFVQACKPIPCFKEQADIIVSRLEHIKQSQGERTALGSMAKLLLADIDLRSDNIRSFSKVKTTPVKQPAVKCWESVRMNQSYESETNDLPITIDVESSLASAFVERGKKQKQPKADLSILSAKKQRQSNANLSILSAKKQRQPKADLSSLSTKKLKSKARSKTTKKDALNMTMM